MNTDDMTTDETKCAEALAAPALSAQPLAMRWCEKEGRTEGRAEEVLPQGRREESRAKEGRREKWWTECGGEEDREESRA